MTPKLRVGLETRLKDMTLYQGPRKKNIFPCTVRKPGTPDSGAH